MCAISGMVGIPAGEQTIQNMLFTMQRRGPDGSGVFQEEDTFLLHTRLAIIDPAGGKQPMELSWGQEKFCIVYNGELYNTQELRQELMLAGHHFTGHSDTEVLLHSYAEYGADCLEKLNGIFAFAVWETRKKRLFLARDRIGVKPLFFSWKKECLIFASEIKTILACPFVPAQLDKEGALQLIMLGPGRLPGSGIFQNIQEIQPGSFGYFENGKLTIRTYWKLLDHEHTDSFEETEDKVRYLIQDAIKRQMVSDVPIGTFLSGGLDSSIITAVCAEEMRGQGEQLKTFSVDYENNADFFKANKFQPSSDYAYIRQMQQFCKTDHLSTVLTPEMLTSVLEDATIARDLPGMADVDFSLLAFCKEIRQNVKVALSGECADEIFGGYPWYRDPEVREQTGFPWAQNTQERCSLLTPELQPDASDFVMDAYLQTCRESDILPGTTKLERRTKEMVNLNFRWFMQTLLDRKDRMSMYHGLEVRVPFCDHRIAEYLYSVPWEMKDHRGQEKGLLRSSVKGLLPEAVLYRKKSPYPKTFDPRYTQIIEDKMTSLFKSISPIWSIVDRKKVQTLMERESKWPWYGQLMRRPQTMAYFLQLDFWMRHYNISVCF